MLFIPLEDDLRLPTDRLSERRLEGDWRGAERMVEGDGCAEEDDAK